MTEQIKQVNIAVRFRGTRIEIDPAHLGVTDGLKVLLRDRPGTTSFDLPRGKFCFRHANRECKYGPRCCNIHVCRKAFDTYFPPPPAEPSAPEPSPILHAPPGPPAAAAGDTRTATLDQILAGLDGSRLFRNVLTSAGVSPETSSQGSPSVRPFVKAVGEEDAPPPLAPL